jgi:hypothetical protein
MEFFVMLKIFATIKILTLFLLCLPTLSFSTELSEIKLWKWDMGNPPVRELLKLVLDHTVEEYGAYQLKPSIDMTHARVSRAVERGLIDVFSNAANQRLEQQVLPIRIPINQGLLGIRVCLIRAGEQSRFDEIHSLADWQNSGLIIGQGSDWMDSKILTANHLKVTTSSQYLTLFEMLVKKRFDCFPRSIAEVQAELEQHGDKGIVLEKHLIFMYRLPLFYWVSKSQPQLAQRIETGLKILQKNGEFKKHFQRQFESFINAIQLEERKVIRLQNPFLSPETQALTQQPALWFELFNETNTTD